MDKTNNLDIFMTDLADSIREATGETGSINAQSFSTRITGLGTGKQDKLVSGENIKTINGESILGSGDITISGGSGVKEIVEITDNSGIIEEFMPNKIYVHTSPTYDIDIWEYITTDAAVDEYITYFKTGTTSLGGGWTPYYSFPAGTLWANGVYPETEPNTLYELSIVKTTIDGDDYFKACLTPFKPVE